MYVQWLTVGQLLVLQYLTPGKKWQSMGADKQDKYRQQYQQLKKEHESKLAAFYDHHPDAKVPVR